MKTFIAVIHGITPLLMHRFSDADTEELSSQTRKINIVKSDPREAAEQCCYRNEAGFLYIPADMPARMLREAGASHKQRGSRRSLKYIIPAVVTITEQKLILRDDNGNPLTHFEVDSRPIVIPSTKGRVLRHRPRINLWNVEVPCEIDDTEISPSTIHELWVDGGKKHGLGDYRPNSGGMFGKFQLHSWQELDDFVPHRLAAE